MAKRIQLRRGTTAEINAFTGAVGEVSVDTDKDVLVVHDGVTAGGFPVAARANANGTISLIKKDGTIIGSINATGLFNNTLTSTATDQALTAAQGKVLQDTKLASNTALGVGQTWQDLTASRVADTVYTNSSLKTIFLAIEVDAQASTANPRTFIKIAGSPIFDFAAVSGGTLRSTQFAAVPAGATYELQNPLSIVKWWEFK